MKEHSKANLRYRVSKYVFLLLVAWLVGLSGIRVYGQPDIKTWIDDGEDDFWSTVLNWDAGLPEPDEIAEFNENDSLDTSVLDRDFTIFGLQYIGNSEHLLDLNGFNLQVDDFVHVGVGDSADGATVIWTNLDPDKTYGTVTIGNPETPGTFYVGVYNSDTVGATFGSLLLDNMTVDAFVSDLSIGRKTSEDIKGSATGSLTLGGNSTLRVGTAQAPAVVNIGRDESSNIIIYGPDPSPAGDAGSVTGELDATEGTAVFHLSELNVGQRTQAGGESMATGTLKTGPGSIITATTANIGTGPNATGIVYMGTAEMDGGLLAAETVNMGAGGTFNFANGRLGIGTFNTYGPDGALDQQGGTLAPGFSHFATSLAGIATINGDYHLASAGTLEIELFGLTPGDDYDQLFVDGIVNLNADLGMGGMLDVVLGFAPEFGDEFIILDNDETDWISGTFAGLPEGAVFYEEYLGSYYPFRISYVGYTGNDVVLTSVVPVPGASVLASLGLLTSMWLCRRKTTNRKGN